MGPIDELTQQVAELRVRLDAAEGVRAPTPARDLVHLVLPAHMRAQATAIASLGSALPR